MRSFPGLKLPFALLIAALLPNAPGQSARAQYVVNEQSDLPDFDLLDGVCSICFEVDGDGNCISPGGCTLVAAIQEANQLADLNGITFTVPEVINDANLLPEINFPVIIDGTVGEGRVHLAGPAPALDFPGLVVSGAGATGSQILDVEISGYRAGIEFRDSPDGLVQGCLIRDNGPGAGITASGASSGLQVGGVVALAGDPPGNVIIGNRTAIVLIGAGNHRVVGNRIGIDELGEARGNVTGISIGIGAGEGTIIGGDRDTDKNVISNSQFDGISVSGTGFGQSEPVTGLKILGNLIGTDVSGREAAGNLRGITLTRTDGIEIGGTDEIFGNRISGNGDGIWLNNNANNTRLIGNTVGLSLVGDTLPNGNGVVIRALARGNLIQSNVIAGNRQDGVLVTEVNGLRPVQNTIELNAIGLDGSHTSDNLGNGGSGVRINEADSNSIGLNHIGANAEWGISVTGQDNAILDNRIGIGASSADSVGNGESGILLSAATGTVVDRNEIGNNGGDGIDIFSSTGSLVRSNRIGVLPIVGNIGFDADNRGVGIRLRGESSGNQIGGLEPDKGNTISNNEQGVVVKDGERNAILGNVIFWNRLLPIDLGEDGNTWNDDGDVDLGANGLQNHPVQISSTTQGQNTVVEGEIRSAASATYRIEFFEDVFGLAQRGYGEAEAFLGALDVDTDASGVGSFTFQYDGIEEVVATATDSLGNTSELALQANPFADWLLRMREETEPTEGEEFKVGILNSNFGTVEIGGVDLRFQTSPNIQLKSVFSWPDATPVNCTGSPDVNCSLGTLAPWSGVKYGARFDVLPGKAAAPYEIRVRMEGTRGSEVVQSNEWVLTGETSVASDQDPVLGSTGLDAVYPNPFVDRATIRLTLADAGRLRLVVVDVLGRTVRRYAWTESPGQHSFVWDGTDQSGRTVAAGVYFVRLEGSNAAVLPLVRVR